MLLHTAVIYLSTTVRIVWSLSLVSRIFQQSFVQTEVRQIAVIEALLEQSVDHDQLLLLFDLLAFGKRRIYYAQHVSFRAIVERRLIIGFGL